VVSINTLLVALDYITSNYEQLMSDGLGRMWNGVVMVKSGVLARDLPGRSVRTTKISVRILDTPAEIRISQLQNTNQKRHRLSQVSDGSQYQGTLTN
jgi:hypothetical protein